MQQALDIAKDTVFEVVAPVDPAGSPARAYPSLSGVGIIVGNFCSSNDVIYYYGCNIVALTGAFLFNPQD